MRFLQPFQSFFLLTGRQIVGRDIVERVDLTRELLRRVRREP